MDIGIDAPIERLEAAPAIGRSINAALLDTDVHQVRIGAIERDRSDVRNQGRGWKAPALASRNLQERGAFAKQMPAVQAAQDACIRGADENLARAVGGRRDRPYFVVANVSRRDVMPGAAAVGRTCE